MRFPSLWRLMVDATREIAAAMLNEPYTPCDNGGAARPGACEGLAQSFKS
jgi:hypothetical protein